MKQLHIRIPDQQRNQLESIADERGMTLNQLIAYAIGSWLREKQNDATTRRREI